MSKDKQIKETERRLQQVTPQCNCKHEEEIEETSMESSNNRDTTETLIPPKANVGSATSFPPVVQN